MQRRQMTVLAAVTAIAVAVAAYVMWKRTPEAEAPRQALVVGLADRIDSIAAIKIQDHDRTLEMRKTDAGLWVAPEKFDYPADVGQVRKLVIGLATMKAAEAKTSNPDLYPRLGVEDITVDGAKSRLVTLLTADGQPAAAVIVGNAAPGKTAAPLGGLTRAYVRLQGEAQSYLAVGAPEIDLDLKKWLDATLFTVEKDRLKRVEVRRPDGKTVAISRAKAEDEFALENMPKGRTAKTYGGVDNLAGAMNYLAFEDVRPAAAMASPVTVTAAAFDGLTVTAQVDGDWAHFSAAFDGAAAEKGEGAAIMPKAPLDGEKEAADINARLGAWDYRLADYKRKDLTPGVEDLLEPRPEKSKK